MTVMDALRALLQKMAPSASASNVVEALNRIGEAEGSQAVAAHDVAAAIQRIADAYSPTSELYMMFLEAHPSWNSGEPEGAKAELDLRATLIRYASTGFATFTWVEELIEQASTGSFVMRLTGADLPHGQCLGDLPTALVASIYGDDLTNGRKTASVIPPVKLNGETYIETPWTEDVAYQVNGQAKIRARFRYELDADEYSLTVNWNIQSPKG
jgi:hypothetical protein